MKVKYILIWGTADPNVADFQKALEEWGKTAKTKNMEILYWGASIGTQERIVICLKGSVTDFERLYGPGTMPPIINNRTNLVAEWVAKD